MPCYAAQRLTFAAGRCGLCRLLLALAVWLLPLSCAPLAELGWHALPELAAPASAATPASHRACLLLSWPAGRS